MKLLIIKALKMNRASAGEAVGMVGDGVNDVLPLKEADFSAAMQSGSDAARNVAGLVLLDNNLASLPRAVAEGRRSINNLERSASLFLTKTIYSLILAVVYLFIAVPFPLLPVQLTLISGLFIGLPSFFLALERNHGLVRGGFVRNVLKNAVPYGLCSATGLLVLAVLAHFLGFSYEETRTAATISLGITSLVILCDVCRPVNGKRFALITASGSLFLLALFYLSEWLFKL
jgi:cation-transporting ATPase E